MFKNTIQKEEKVMNKKKVTLIALAICLIAVISMGSLAWFQASDEVTNNFMFGDSDTPSDGVFGIEVWEDRDTNGDGDYNEVGDAEKADGLEYEAILPGEVLSKEPYLENTGIHSQFVRAIVTVTDASVLRDAMEGAWGNADLFLPGTPDTWVLEDILYTTDNELVYVYYYTEVLEAGAKTDKIFTDVVIPTGLTKEMAAEIDDFQINILGQAIQSEHILVDTAQEAFAKYWDAAGTIAGYTNEQINANAKINNETTTDVYISVNKTDYPSAEISLTGETISVTEAIVKVDETVLNSTILIDSCTLTVADGAYIAYYDEPGGHQVIITPDTTINGVAAGDMEQDELLKYFHNNDSVVWVMEF